MLTLYTFLIFVFSPSVITGTHRSPNLKEVQNADAVLSNNKDS